MISIYFPLLIFWKGTPMRIYLCLQIGSPLPPPLYSHTNWSAIIHKTMSRVPFIIASAIHFPSDSTYLFPHIHVSPHYLHFYSRYFGVIWSGEILPAVPWYFTWSSPVCSIDTIIVNSGGCYTCACSILVGSHLVLITYIQEVYLSLPFVSFIYSNTVDGVSSAICLSCPVLFYLPRGRIKVQFLMWWFSLTISIGSCLDSSV